MALLMVEGQVLSHICSQICIYLLISSCIDAVVEKELIADFLGILDDPRGHEGGY